MVTQVGIAGCGLMGSAIADTNLKAGYDVVIFDINESQLSNAKEKLDKKINESNHRISNRAQSQSHFIKSSLCIHLELRWAFFKKM